MSTVTKRLEEVTMKKAIIIGTIMVVLLAVNGVQAQTCQIVNGSFEDDGWIDFPPAPNEPNGWDVNIPDYNKFDGYIHRDWPTDRIYNLTFFSQWTTYTAEDKAIVSQEIDLTDANEIVFDLRLDTDWLPWDPNMASAIVSIEEDVVWDSNDRRSGEHPNEVYTVEDKYRDGAPHTVSFGLRIKVTGGLYQSYYTDWDDLKCTEFCGGGGLLAGDFNHDCYVDYNDLELFADVWLTEVEKYDRYNLCEGDDGADDGGIVTLCDFVIFASNWQQSSYVEPNEP